MLRTIFTLSIVLVSSAQTFALDWSLEGTNRDVLKLRSDKPGIVETFEIIETGGELRIEQTFNGQTDSVALSANLVRLIHFIGDDERDEVFCWTTEIPLIAEGQGGNDELWGGENNDTLIGGEGKDFLFGRGGRDRLNAGQDLEEGTVNGGDGVDTADITTFVVTIFPYRFAVRPTYEDAPGDIENYNRITVQLSIIEYFRMLNN